jgi:DNA replication protein DnaC
LASFGLKRASEQLPLLLENAARENQTPREFLLTLLDSELTARNEKKRRRNYSGAHFPPNVKHIDEFNTAELEGGITPTQIMELKELNWVDAATDIILLGPPGVGKTMLAIGLGLEAINAGYTVCFERMSNLIEILDNRRKSRAAAFRYRRVLKSQVVIIDEIGFLPINRDQANAFFSLVSELYQKSSVIITTNKEIENWDEILGDPVLTGALLDRIMENSRCFSLRGQSYRLKHPITQE